MFTAWTLLLMLPATGPLKVPSPAIDAGEIYVGQPLVRGFAIANSGQSPLTITRIATSCGCAAPTVPRKTLDPGQRSELTVDVNTLSQPSGPVRWSMQVHYRSGNTDYSTTLELTAKLIREIEIQPAALAVAARPGFEHEIKLVDHRARPLTITAVRTDTPSVGATLVPATATIRVRMSESCPEGSVADTLRIATDDPKYPELRVPITLTRLPSKRVTAMPARAVLAATGSALIQIRSRESLRIESIESGHPALTVRWAAGSDTAATMRVALERSKWDGQPFASEVKVRFARPAGETIAIPVQVRSED